MAKAQITESGGNVFADIGLPDADELDLKASLVFKIADVMDSRQLTQTAAAKLTGLSQPDFSRILNGNLRDMSVERLFRVIVMLDADVEINVSQEGQSVGEPIHLHHAQPVPA
jgi:predicted XRE-type DNA-binding protein